MGRKNAPLISALALERPGAWRWVLGLSISFLLLAPMAPLLFRAFQALPQGGLSVWVGEGFLRSLGSSAVTGLFVALISLTLGLPLGGLAAAYAFPGRSVFLMLLAMPLLVPSFLWAIGLSDLRMALGLSPESVLSGSTGTVLAFVPIGLALVMISARAGAGSMTQSQSDALRLAGGEKLFLRRLIRTALPSAGLAAAFVGILTLSDPGPSQIMGTSGAASELLISFSALYDFELATRQCVTLGAATFLLGLPIASLLGGKMAHALLGRDTAPLVPRSAPATSRRVPALFSAVFLVVAFVPILGLLAPTLRAFPIERALGEASRSAGNTILYAFSAGLTATILGFALATSVGRNKKAQSALLSFLFLALCLPPSLGSLGIIFSASEAPAWMDPILRSRFTVGAVLGLRLVPVACILALRAMAASSPAWVGAAALHGMGVGTYLRRVLFPWLKDSALQSFVLVSLLATAEIGTVVLLRPPGEDSFPVAIFTVMANAPEPLVAVLCLLYLVGAGIVLSLVGWGLGRRVA